MAVVRFASAPKGRVKRLSDGERMLSAQARIAQEAAEAAERRAAAEREVAEWRQSKADDFVDLREQHRAVAPNVYQQMPSVPMPAETTLIVCKPDMELVMGEDGKALRNDAGEAVYRKAAFNSGMAGKTAVCARRWSKRPQTSQTFQYVAEPFVRYLPDGTRIVEPGTVHRVGNVPATLASCVDAHGNPDDKRSEELRAIAALMRP